MLQTKQTFKLKTKELKNVLVTFGVSVSNNKNSPQKLIINVEGNKITLSVSSKENFVSYDFNTEKDNGCFKFCINFNLLKNAIKKSKEEYIKFVLDNDNVSILNDNVETTIPTEDIVYNTYEPIEKSNVVYCESVKELLPVLRKAIVCSSKYSARYTMNTIAIDGKTIVATDGKKIYKDRIETQKNVFILIKKSSAEQILKCMEKQPECIINIYSDETNIMLTIENYTIYSKLHEGTYPPYQVVFPKNQYHDQFYLEVNPMLNILENIQDKYVNIGFDIDYKGRYEIMINGEIKIPTYILTRNCPILINKNYNRKYLLDFFTALKKNKTKNVCISIDQEEGKLILSDLKSTTYISGFWMYVLMFANV